MACPLNLVCQNDEGIDLLRKKCWLTGLFLLISLVNFIQLLVLVDKHISNEKTLTDSLVNSLSTTFTQLLYSSDLNMSVEKSLMQTLACQQLY